MEQVHNHHSRIAVIGASRGLGAAVVRKLRVINSEARILKFSRTPPEDIADWVKADISHPEDQRMVVAKLLEWKPSLVICTLGGGPYGYFGGKNWESHLWGFQVSLLFPARLLHMAMQSEVSGFLRQMVVVGSSVAEDQPDAKAASYASAKHGLFGLWRTLRAEPQNGLDLRLYSPGYMDTTMIPAGSLVRHRTLWNPQAVADDLIQWLDSGPRFDHRSLALYPSDS
jgi:NAD(P)-dependent dehydrogenase (short-subunit alcohol dehydrogenase family)